MSSNFIDRVKSKYTSNIIDCHDFRGDQTITIRKENSLELFKFLRDDPDLDFNFLMDLTAVDYLNRKDDRFEIVYHLYSLKHNARLRVKIPVSEDDCSIDYVTSHTSLYLQHLCQFGILR